MDGRELEISMDGRRVGVLDGADRRSLRIIYDEDWSSDPDSTPLSVSMLPAASVHSGKRVAAYLWGLLPDNDRVLERWAKANQCSATDVFGILRGVGADVAGAAQYLEPGTASEDADAGTFEPLGTDGVAALLRTVRADATAWHPQARGHWSLAGAQAKIALAYDGSTASWGIPAGSRPTTHIFKPGIAGLVDHDINEHLCLDAARQLGLRVVESRVLRFDDERALVVTRYDRLLLHGEMRRVHQEDCCQALGIHPELKYQADGGPSIEDIATLLRDVEVTHADADVDDPPGARQRPG